MSEGATLHRSVCAVGKSRQCPPLAFMLKKDILSTCSNNNHVM